MGKYNSKLPIANCVQSCNLRPMTMQEAQQFIVTRLSGIYDSREAMNIADWVLEHLAGKKKIDRIINKNELLTATQLYNVEKYVTELATHKPVQYVLNESWFYGMKLLVNEAVLIPRPETEELVEWVLEEVRSQKPEGRRILDIGTGSGCIPIALQKHLPGFDIYSCDISSAALEVAKQNAASQQTPVHFLQLNFLDRNTWNELPDADIIVSNPPYIPQRDKLSMHKNVLDFEPHIALFVENDDPLLFYTAIAEFALRRKRGVAVYAEIHEKLGSAVQQLFIAKGFSDVELRKDLQGKDRMLKARWGV